MIKVLAELLGWLLLLLQASVGPTPFVIRDVRLFDGEHISEHRTVLVQDGKIVAVGDAGMPAPGSAESIDGKGRTLLPGLIDAHVHLPLVGTVEALQQSLAFGVTTVVNMWTAPPPRGFTGKSALVRMKEIEADDPLDAADLRTAGTGATATGGHPTQMESASAGGPPIASNSPTIDAAADARAFVDARLAEGSDFLKIIYDDARASFGRNLPTLDEDTIAALVSATHAHGRLAVAHIGTERHAIGAIRAGVDGLAHLFVGPTVSNEFVQLAKDRNTFVMPTLSVLYAVCGQPDGQRVLDDAKMMARVRPQFRVTLSMPMGGITPSCAGAKAAVPRLYEEGVALVAGTDAPAAGSTFGASLHLELEHLVDAGMPAVAALSSATSVAARAFRMTDRGRILAGMRADLLLVEGDPTVDIRATRNIVRVWKKGAGSVSR
jgi:imidazolonepropionase-like amidohydrolase